MTQVVPTTHKNSYEHRRQLATSLNQVVNGKVNSVNSLTLDANQSSTTYTDRRVGANSVILLMPTSQNAAGEYGQMYITLDADNRQFTIHHGNESSTDRTFNYVVLG